jgi:FdhD protein
VIARGASSPGSNGSVRLPLVRIDAAGGIRGIERDIACEAPIAIEFNGIGYAVLMATPDDLEDLAWGFAHAERLIDRADQLIAAERHQSERGIILRATLAPECRDRLLERVRHRVSESACGICGIENLEQALRPLPRIGARTEADDAAVFRALERLRAEQALSRLTGAVHAAAACSAAGEILLTREDVGRHNAFDKLVGAMLRSNAGWNGGFALLSSRCSYELVEKAALIDCPMLVTISAPTSLAIERAAQAGLELRVLARRDALLSSPLP